MVPRESAVRCSNFGNHGKKHLSQLYPAWLDQPQKILAAGWDFLVYPVMREGGYIRYDGRKSTQVLRDCETLMTDYGGSLSRLHDAARDARDLEERLLAFYGVGPVTMNIFLREMRPFWAKADSGSSACCQNTGETAFD